MFFSIFFVILFLLKSDFPQHSINILSRAREIRFNSHVRGWFAIRTPLAIHSSKYLISLIT